MPRPLPVGLAGRIHRLDRLVLAYHPPQFLPRARVGLLNRGHQAPGLRLNEHIEHDGPIVFAHACRMGLEGIVSKRKASPYRSGRTADWIKSKNPDAPAVKREAEQEWDRWPSKKARPSSRC